jgi:hypothetical protein
VIPLYTQAPLPSMACTVPEGEDWSPRNWSCTPAYPGEWLRVRAVPVVGDEGTIRAFEVLEICQSAVPEHRDSAMLTFSQRNGLVMSDLVVDSSEQRVTVQSHFKYAYLPILFTERAVDTLFAHLPDFESDDPIEEPTGCYSVITWSLCSDCEETMVYTYDPADSVDAFDGLWQWQSTAFLVIGEGAQSPYTLCAE